MDSNRDSFDQFFRRRFPLVTAFLIKQGVEREDAQDAAQEAMKEAYRTWTSIEQPDAWVYRVALRYAAKQEKRQAAGIEKAVKDANEGGWCTPVPPHCDDTTFKEEQRRVLAALQLLPLKQRQVFALHLDGYTTDEIAELLEMQPQTIRSHRRHARNRLERELWSPPGPGQPEGGRRC